MHNCMPFSYDFTEEIQIKHYPILCTEILVLMNTISKTLRNEYVSATMQFLYMAMYLIYMLSNG